jgi:dihydrofolate reductase
LDGCCDHRAIAADEQLHRHATENLKRADALLFGRVTYETMEAAFRPPAGTEARPNWMEPFAHTIDAAKKYVVSSTLGRVDWNAELVRGNLGDAIQRLKRESGKGLLVGGAKLPLSLAKLGLIDEYEFVVQPRLAGHGPRLFAGLPNHVDLRLVSRLEFASGAVAMLYQPRKFSHWPIRLERRRWDNVAGNVPPFRRKARAHYSKVEMSPLSKVEMSPFAAAGGGRFERGRFGDERGGAGAD